MAAVAQIATQNQGTGGMDPIRRPQPRPNPYMNLTPEDNIATGGLHQPDGEVGNQLAQIGTMTSPMPTQQGEGIEVKQNEQADMEVGHEVNTGRAMQSQLQQDRFRQFHQRFHNRGNWGGEESGFMRRRPKRMPTHYERLQNQSLNSARTLAQGGRAPKRNM